MLYLLLFNVESPNVLGCGKESESKPGEVRFAGYEKVTCELVWARLSKSPGDLPPVVLSLGALERWNCDRPYG
jgi:hypothetical protein